MNENTPPKSTENLHGNALDAALEKAFEAQRVKKGSRMIATETPTDRITDEQCKSVIEATKGYLKEKGMHKAQLANALCLGASTVSQVLNGNYNADPRSVVVAMDRWLERRLTADDQPQVNKFIWTDVAKMIRLAMNRAIAAADAGGDQRISLVWGDPGCGKTLALQAIAQREDAIYITCGIDLFSSRAILHRIGESLRIPLGISGAEAFRNVVERLRGSGKPIIVDEIHALLDARDDNAFHTLRRLSDQTGCPQLWAATCDLIGQLRMREHKREPLGQIISRIGSQFHLTAKLHGSPGHGGKPEPLFTVEQVLQMYGSNEMKLTPDAARFLARLCTSPMRGLLRTCTGLVMHATVSNRLKGGSITPEMLWEAALFLFQDSVVMQMQAELREELSEMKLRLASA